MMEIRAVSGGRFYATESECAADFTRVVPWLDEEQWYSTHGEVTEAKRRFHLDQLSCASVKIDERSEAQKSNAEKNSKGDVQCLK